MKKISEPIVFFGSGPVAAKSLEFLAQNFDVEAVITKPQPPHHREPFPVLLVAKQLGLKIFTPNSKKALSELFTTNPFASRLGIIIDYGFIINQDVIDYFQLGIINSHFSLLPQWRGADPISFSILSGQKLTGVSLMLITAGMDEGPVLAEGVYDMTAEETSPSLTERLIKLSDALLSDTIPNYITGDIKPAPQAWVAKQFGISPQPTFSRKLTKNDGIIKWDKPAEQIEREIRAFIEWPKSHTTIAGKDVIITKAHVVEVSDTPSTLINKQKELLVACSHQSLAIERLKPAGKQEMTAEAFLAGYRQLL